ncbi:hypothetical protein ACL02T_00975 [Pseudonocardia sp. RS010]|uniref:hypothetical protein n=1 Tax=Pseudonocardia sp. RS010 TaxID=3385979 RepID=UPI0039A25AA6
MTPGYRKLDDVNDKKFTEDGWFRTSDLVRSDEDGFLYWTCRSSRGSAARASSCRVPGQPEAVMPI